MRKIVFVLMLAAALLTVSCDGENENSNNGGGEETEELYLYIHQNTSTVDWQEINSAILKPIDIKIFSNTAWTIEYLVPWMGLAPYEGTGDCEKMYYDVKENPYTYSRPAKFIVRWVDENNKQHKEEIIITQDGKEDRLHLTVDTQQHNLRETDVSFYVNISSNTEWSIKIDQGVVGNPELGGNDIPAPTWLTAPAGWSGVGDDKIFFCSNCV